MPKAGCAAASGSPQPPHRPAQPSPHRSGCGISSWLRLWHTWPLFGCQRRLPGLPVRQTSRPWHQVGNEPRTAPEGIFSPLLLLQHKREANLCPSLFPLSLKAPRGEGLLKSCIFVHNIVSYRGFCWNTSPCHPADNLPSQGGCSFELYFCIRFTPRH